MEKITDESMNICNTIFSKVMFTFLTLYSFEVFIAETMYNLSLPKLFSKNNVYIFYFGYI